MRSAALSVIAVLFIWLGQAQGRADELKCPDTGAVLSSDHAIEVFVPKLPPSVNPATGVLSLGVNGCLRVLASSNKALFYRGSVTAAFFDSDDHFLAAGGQPIEELDPESGSGTLAAPLVPTTQTDAPRWHKFGLTGYVDYPLQLRKLAQYVLLEVTLRECAAASPESACNGPFRTLVWAGDALLPPKIGDRDADPGMVTSDGAVHPAPAHVPTQPHCASLPPSTTNTGARVSGTHMRLAFDPIRNGTVISLEGCIRYRKTDGANPFATGAVAAFFYGPNGQILWSDADATRPRGQWAPLVAFADIKVEGDATAIRPATDGIHLFGFEYFFAGVSIRDVLPLATVVTTAQGCSSNNSITCAGASETFVQTVTPCLTIPTMPQYADFAGCPSLRPKPDEGPK